MFEGREIRLMSSCAVFITMNPGYAGRTELPDNLKALFRPISMMVPDYRECDITKKGQKVCSAVWLASPSCAPDTISIVIPGLIAEVILYSEGFEDSKNLAQKMTQMYKLCSEQLSQQDHYDFGMRAVKSVLVMAGSLKRQNPDKSEDVVLIRALRDSNLPKFLKDDANLFKVQKPLFSSHSHTHHKGFSNCCDLVGTCFCSQADTSVSFLAQAILQDLFPGVVIPDHDYGRLKVEIEEVARAQNLQVVESQTRKVIDLYETMLVRHGVMLVGPTGGGKSTVYRNLARTCENLHAAGLQEEDPFFMPVHIYVMNPKSITMGELYGEIDKLTLEWRDGLMGITVRNCVNVS